MGATVVDDLKIVSTQKLFFLMNQARELPIILKRRNPDSVVQLNNNNNTTEPTETTKTNGIAHQRSDPP
jgi:hypothetical protein